MSSPGSAPAGELKVKREIADAAAAARASETFDFIFTMTLLFSKLIHMLVQRKLNHLHVRMIFECHSQAVIDIAWQWGHSLVGEQELKFLCAIVDKNLALVAESIFSCSSN